MNKKSNNKAIWHISSSKDLQALITLFTIQPWVFCKPLPAQFLRHNNNKTSYVSLKSRLAIDLLKININKGDLNSDTYRCGGYGYSSRSSGVARAPVRKSLIPPPSIEPLARPRKSAGFSVRHQRPVKCRARCPIFLSKKRENEKYLSLQF